MPRECSSVGSYLQRAIRLKIDGLIDREVAGLVVVAVRCFLNCDKLHGLCDNENKSQIIRELIVFGFNYYVDYEKLKDVSKELNTIGKNINQIATRVNATGNIYKDDISDIQKEMKEIWQSLRSTLSGQVFRKQ